MPHVRAVRSNLQRAPQYSVRGDGMDNAGKKSASNDDQILIERVEGVVTFERILSRASEVIESPGWTWSQNVLVDLNNASLQLTSAHIRSLSEMVITEKLDSPIRLAIVTPRDVDFGLSRMYATLAADSVSSEVQVFRSEQSALKWLTDRHSG